MLHVISPYELEGLAARRRDDYPRPLDGRRRRRDAARTRNKLPVPGGLL